MTHDRTWLRMRAAAFARHGGVAGAAVVAAGIVTGMPTLLAIGLLALCLAAYVSIFSKVGSY
ncbi:hypothetical protein MalM25_11070 [Planctomycetes bacterium MalM25]|nr:hypothetical protein MalM25_11070 [Planctomycetes bacterium MalM25]